MRGADVGPLVLAFALSASPLGEAMQHYADLDYEGCVAALGPATGKLRGGARASAELYFGLCEFALGHDAAARRHLEAALRLDAKLEPPPSASPKERALFDDVSRAVAASPRPQVRKPPAKRPDAPDDTAPPDTDADAPRADPELEPSPPPEVAPAPVAVVAPPPPLEPAARPSVAPPLFLTVLGAGAGLSGALLALNAQRWADAGRAERVQVVAGRYVSEANTRFVTADVLFVAAGLTAAIATWLWLRFAAQ